MSEHLIGLSDKIGKYEAELAYLRESKVGTWHFDILTPQSLNAGCEKLVNTRIMTL
jgi:hypothetical protein